MEYIKRLDIYDALDIANIAINNQLYEENFSLFENLKNLIFVEILKCVNTIV